MANLEGRIFPKSFTAVWKNCRNAYSKVLESEGFKQEFHQLLRDYVDALHLFTWQTG